MTSPSKSDSGQKEEGKHGDMTVLEIVHEFGNSTSLHGLGFAIDPHSSRIKRCFWTFCFFCATSVLIYITTGVIQRAMNPPIKTQVSTEINSATLDFPAVTVCNLNQNRLSYFDVDSKFWLLLSHIYNLSSVVDTSSFDSLNVTEAFIQSAHKWEKMAASCYWKQSLINCSQYARMLLTDMGVCYTVNYDEHSPLNATGPGLLHGLFLYIDVETAEYTFSVVSGDSIGMKVLVHDPKESPAVNQLGIAVAPSTHTQIGIRKRKRLSTTLTGCLDTADPSFRNPLKFNKYYSRHACLEECKSKFVYEECGCKRITQPGNYPACRNHSKFWCNVFASYRDTADMGTCECPLPCQEYSYDYRVSTAKFPNPNTAPYVAGLFNISEAYYMSNFLKISVYYEDLSVQVVTQSPGYSFVDAGSDFGGWIGLTIGASMLTFAEICTLAVNCFCRILSKISHQRVAASRQ